MAQNPFQPFAKILGFIAILLLVFTSGCDRDPVPSANAVRTPSDLPRTASTFTGAKKALYDQVYHDHRLTFYCGCDYSVDRKIDLASCGLTALADKPRAQRIEAEHIFPAAQFGNFRPCWRNPGEFPECVKSSGKTVSGRECCQRVDSVFEAAHNDLMNLVPSVGEVNGIEFCVDIWTGNPPCKANQMPLNVRFTVGKTIEAPGIRFQVSETKTRESFLSLSGFDLERQYIALFILNNSCWRKPW
jgi:endonuclease I